MADFRPVMEYISIAEIDAGITCINVPNAPMAVKAGHPATLQLTYVTDYGSPSGKNITFYSCADITYVSPSDVPYPIPCFNTTEPKDRYAFPPPGPKLGPTKDFPLAEEEDTKPEKRHHGRPRWVIAAAGMGGAFGATLFMFLVCKCTAAPRTRHRSLMDFIKRPRNMMV
ncbi:hypothetical protein J3F84DRAFT_359451 [Trichoderma pleuroticola]